MLVTLRAQRVRADQKLKKEKIQNDEHFSSYILKECLTLVLCNMEKRIKNSVQIGVHISERPAGVYKYGFQNPFSQVW